MERKVIQNYWRLTDEGRPPTGKPTDRPPVDLSKKGKQVALKAVFLEDFGSLVKIVESDTRTKQWEPHWKLDQVVQGVFSSVS